MSHYIHPDDLAGELDPWADEISERYYRERLDMEREGEIEAENQRLDWLHDHDVLTRLCQQMADAAKGAREMEARAVSAAIDDSDIPF